MPKFAYVHIPFCKNKCNYCTFVSLLSSRLIEPYLKALSEEISRQYEKKDTLETLYLGGGTPSLLNAFQIQENIFSHFSFDKNCEITIEANPNDLTLQKLKSFKDIGINRISFGVQTFNDKSLNFLGRTHTKYDAIEAIENAQKANFNNISIDLIYGLENQSVKDFKKDLNIAVKLPIKHISLYGLKIEKGSFFYKNRPQNLANSDLQANMYEFAIDFLKHYKFKHYEISNFAKDKFESIHNLCYWNNYNYYGFGLNACGYKNNIRYQNEIKLRQYLNNPFSKIYQNKLSSKDQLLEQIFLNFRKVEGLDVNYINKKFNINFDLKYKQILKKFIPEFIESTENGYKLTQKGMLVSNEILCLFLV